MSFAGHKIVERSAYMENVTEICREILSDFLNRWTVDQVKKMTLEQYVSVGNPDTFCQWVETKTVGIGNIKGPAGSIKFGIYKRTDKNKKPGNYDNDEQYSWQKAFNAKTKDEAFQIVKNEIIKIVKCADEGDFGAIDSSKLYDIFKWKVACLYSNERIIPIFKRDWLERIAERFEMPQNSPISLIQQELMSRKPIDLSVYEYASRFWKEFGEKSVPKASIIMGRATRKAAAKKNTKTQTRNGASAYFATQKHNVLQEALKNKLVAKFGKQNVLIEENFVDIKVVQPDKIYFYEVKSSAYASDCIREALGQILSYAHKDTDSRPKQLIVAGQYKPNADEVRFVDYVKTNLKIDFSYENVDLE